MIPVNDPLLESREKELLCACFDSGWLSGEGKFVGEFERLFADYLGVKHGVAVCNGTVALELAVTALKFQPGDEVLIPAFTIISCATALLRNGLTPVLVDAEPTTWGMDMSQVEILLENNPRIKAAMPVHIYGHPCDMQPLLALSAQYGVQIIEDAAEVHGAECRINTSGATQWKRCGAMGDLGCFSFYANKIVTTGEGGMVVTDDDALAERLRLLRNLGFQQGKRFEHEVLGYNFRMGNLQAAVGVAQTERIAALVERKIWQGTLYRQLLANMPGITLQAVQDWARPVYWVNGIVLDDALPFDAPALAAELLKQGIQTRPFFWPMHQQPVLQKLGLFAGERYPVAERLARRGLYLPSGMALSEQQIHDTCDTLKQALGQS